MKFSEQVNLFLDELEARTVEPVEGVAIEVVRQKWIPLMRQLEAEITLKADYIKRLEAEIKEAARLEYGFDMPEWADRVDALLTGEQDEN